MERYTPGHSSNVTSFMARRSLATHGEFFLPFLFQGATVLDCGCGPGSITADIARLVSPGGLVKAVDANRGQVELARQKLRDFSNVECRVASIYELPFETDYFDAVFAHALFEHLADPLRAARELLRVLKPGGVVGLRSPDWTGKLTWPASDRTEQALAFYRDRQATNGGDLEVGRKLGCILSDSGFDAIRGKASYECYAPVQLIGEYLAAQIEKHGPAESGQPATEELADALRRWSSRPDAFFAQAWCEVVGRKPAETLAPSPTGDSRR